jgi:hypothetical protein
MGLLFRAMKSNPSEWLSVGLLFRRRVTLEALEQLVLKTTGR